MKIIIVNPTTNIGKEIVKYLYKMEINTNNIIYLDAKGLDQKISFGKKSIDIKNICNFNFEEKNIYLFTDSNIIFEQYINKVINNATFIINLSPYHITKTPLIIPEINWNNEYNKYKMVTNPHSITIPTCIILKPLHSAFKIRKIIITTYQSASGEGQEEMKKLYHDTKQKLLHPFQNQDHNNSRSFNIIPVIGDTSQNGYSFEESKIISEIKHILSPNIEVEVTCTKVPVFIGHSLVINIECITNVNIKTALESLKEQNNIQITNNHKYCTPAAIIDSSNIHISRIRKGSNNKSLILWIVYNNLRKGSILNAIQILTKYIHSINPYS